MFARFPHVRLVIALAIAVVITVTAFAAFHAALGLRSAEIVTPQIVTEMKAGAMQALPSNAATFGEPAPTPADAEGAMPRVKLAAPPGNGILAPVSSSLVPPPPRGRGPAQLIRTANITIEVADVTKSLRAATAITDEQLGDVLGLNDDTPSSPDDLHTATMQVRVPQYRFEQTLDALGTLGKVKAKSVNAQDVSNQIVDASARLRNLRRTEGDILNIMDRSGNIEQVLDVTQQLSSVREQIERLDAQIQSMQYQVAYSTINITLTNKPIVAGPPTGFALLAVAWKRALLSVRDLTVSLLSLGLWIVAFSPYILVLVLAVILIASRLRATAAPKGGAAT